MITLLENPILPTYLLYTATVSIQRTKWFPIERMCSVLPDKDGVKGDVPRDVDSEWLASALDKYNDEELRHKAFNRTLDPSSRNQRFCRRVNWISVRSNVIN